MLLREGMNRQVQTQSSNGVDDDTVSKCLGFSRPRKPATAKDDIVELLWQNGQAVVQNQRFPKKGCVCGGEAVIPAEREFGEDMSLLMQDDELASWMQYPLDDSALERDLYADFLLPAAPPVASIAASQLTPIPEISTLAAPPPPSLQPVLPPPGASKAENFQRLQNFSHFSRLPSKSRPEAVPQPSMRAAVDSTVVESNGVPVLLPEPDPTATGSSLLVNEDSLTDATVGVAAGEIATSTCDLTLTSSISRNSFIATVDNSCPDKRSPAAAEDRKRKGREAEDVEYRSEDGRKQGQASSSSTKRSRSAEVHNLSERKRRDRINEKMRALQELIPCCNKADKASMLDEAIEYLKSLQLQVQMMSMVYGMVPMMYPGVPPFIPQMGMGMGLGMGMGMGLNRPVVPFATMVQPGSAGPRFAPPHSPFSDQTQPERRCGGEKLQGAEKSSK